MFPVRNGAHPTLLVGTFLASEQRVGHTYRDTSDVIVVGRIIYEKATQEEATRG